MAFGAKIKLSVDSSGKREFQKQIQNAVNEATAKSPIKLNSFKVSISGKDATALRKQIQDSIQKTDFTIKINKIDASKPVADLKKQLTTMLSGLSITGVKDFIGTDASTDAVERATAAAEKLAEAQENVRVKTTAANAALKELNALQQVLDGVYKKTQNNINTSEAFSELVVDYRLLTAEIQKAKELEGEAQKEALANASARTSALRQRYDELLRLEKAERREADSEADAAVAAEKAAKKEQDLIRRTIELRKQLTKWKDANPKAYKEYADQIDAIFERTSDPTSVSEAGLAELKRLFSEIGEAANAAGLSGQTFWNKLKSGWQKFGNWSIVTKTFNAVVTTIKKMVSAITELDAAMTELRKVTDLTELSYDKFFNTAASLAKSTGSTIADTINSVADYSRLGFDLADATALAEASLIYKNVGDGIDDISFATESVISTMKAFGIEADNAMHIVDAFNEVGNNFAISSSGIGEALQRSASSMAAAGNTMEETIGLVTAMNSVVQNPQTVGTTLKTMSMYLRAAKTELEAAGESTEGMANSVAELQEELLNLTGVDIMLDSGSFKSTYQIVEELASVWDKLADVDQANVLELIGGKRNANAISALLTNFKDAEDAMQAAVDSVGSAALENEKYLESINGMIATMKASFEELSQTFLGSDIVKTFISLATAILDVANALAKAKLLLPAITASLLVIEKIKGAQNINNVAKAIERLIDPMSNADIDFDAITKKCENLTRSQKAMVGEILKSSDAFQSLSGRTQRTVMHVSGISRATRTTTLSLKNLGTAAKTAFTNLSLISKVSIIITLATTLYNIVSHFVNKAKEAKEAAIESATAISDAYNETKESTSSNVEQLENLRERFEELSACVDENGNNISLTASEYEEYLSIIGKIVDISPAIVKGYDNERASLASYKTALDDAIASQKAYAERQKDIYLSSRDNIFAGTQAKVQEVIDGAKEESKDLAATFYSLRRELFGMFADNSQLVDVLNEFGDKFDIDGLGELTTQDGILNSSRLDSLFALYERRSEFMQYLADNYELDPNGELYDTLKQQIGAFAAVQQEYEDAYSDWYDWIREFISGDEQQSWYSLIPDNAKDEFDDFIKESCLGFEALGTSAYDAEQHITGCGEAFAQAINSDGAKEIIAMSEGLADGTEEDVANYNQAVAEFVNTLGASAPVAEAVSAYLLSFTNNFSDAATATNSASTSISGLSKSLQELKKGYDLLATAQSEMYAGGGLSAETVQSILDSLGEKESISDYLNVENGLITLNTTKWRERSEAMLKSDITAIEASILALEDENAELEERNKRISHAAALQLDPSGISLDAALAENEDQIAKNTERMAELNAQLELYKIAYGDITSPLDLTGMVDQLDNITSGASEIASAMQSLKSGTALSNDELTALAMKYPTLMNEIGAIGAKSAEEQMDAIEPLMEAYEQQYDAAIDAQIELLNTAKAEAEASGQSAASIEATIANLERLKSYSLSDILGTGESDLSAVISREAEAYTNVISAMKESASATGLSSDSIEMLKKRYAELKNADISGLFERTANGIRLNTEALNDLEDAYEAQKAEEYAEQLEALSDEYESLSAQIENAEAAGIDASALYAQRDGVAAQAEAVANLAAQYRGLASDYNQWVQARNGSEEGDMYDDVVSGMESALELYKNGLVGTNEFRAAADYMAYEDLSNASTEAIVAAFEAGYPKMKKYFTEGSEGAKAFLNDVSKINSEWAHINENGEWEFNFDTEEVAKQFGLSVDAIEAILRKLKDYGFEVNLDSDYKDLEETKNAAQRAAASLNELGKTDYSFNFDTTSVDRLDEQIEVARQTLDQFKNSDGSVNMSLEGAQEAQQILAALIRQKQSLDQASILKVDTANASGELGEVLRQLQSLKVDYNDLEVQTEIGADTSQMKSDIDAKIAALNAEHHDMLVALGIDTTSQETMLKSINELTPEVLVQCGLDSSLIDDYMEAEHQTTGLVTWENDRTAVDAFILEEHTDTGDFTWINHSEDVNSFKTEVHTATGDFTWNNKPEEVEKYKKKNHAQKANFTWKNIATAVEKFKNKVHKVNGTVVWYNDTRYVKTKFTATGTVNWANGGLASGTAHAAGTAGIQGVAKAHGDWGTKDSGIALGGELGQELVVRNGKFFTIGDHGAGFFSYKKGDIIFNAEQTRAIFEKGQITSGQTRGRVYANGTAFASGSGSFYTPSANIVGSSQTSSGKPTTSSSSSSSNSDSDKPLTAIEQLKEQYEQLVKTSEHLIEHQEFLFSRAEQGLDFHAMNAALTEQAALYRVIMQDAQKAVKEMRKKGATDTTEELQEMEQIYWDAYENFREILDQINTLQVDALHEKIDSLQDAYSSLTTAADEFASGAGISMDTFQDLLSNGIQYLSLLENTGGQFNINRDAVEKLIAAEKEQLAIESALSYLNQIKTALSDKDVNAVAELVDATGQIAKSTWSYVYAQAAALRNAGLTAEQYEQLIRNLDALKAISAGVNTDLGKTSESVLESYTDQTDALEQILELTEDLIRYETEKQIEAINDQVDGYRKIIDLKKKSLQASRDENDYEEQVAEKVADIAKLQSQIDMLALDDSREAYAQRMKLQEELAQRQQELADIQSDHAYNAQIEALDGMMTSYEEEKQNEIAALEASIASSELLHNAALQRLSEGWDTLYADLIAWNTTAGSSLNSEITENWKLASAAVQEYGTYLEAVAALQAAVAAGESTGSNNTVAEGETTQIPAQAPQIEQPTTPPTSGPTTPIGGSSSAPTTSTPPASSEPEQTPESPSEPEQEVTPVPIKKVKITSGTWNVRKGAGKKYKSIGYARKGDKFEYLDKSGSWYGIKFNGNKRWVYGGDNNLKIIEELPKYHTGGIVGGEGAINNREVLAVLEKGEVVLDEPKKRGLYKVIDFQNELAERLGAVVSALKIPDAQVLADAYGKTLSDVKNTVTNNSSVFSPTISVEITHSGEMTDAAASGFGKKIANTALDLLHDAFERRGIGTLAGVKLRQ